jgi:hypothetical protein
MVGATINDGSIEVIDCTFEDNIAHECCDTGVYWTLCFQDGLPNGQYWGGGADLRTVFGGEVRIVNSLFARNEAEFAGGLHLSSCGDPAFELDGGVVELINSTIVENIGSGAHVRLGSAGTVSISNSIVHANLGEEALPILIQNPEEGSVVSVSYSNVEGGVDGEGNIDESPTFAGDYRLGAGSAGIDAGSNERVPVGIVTDLGGAARFVDDPGTDDTGLGESPIVDMGAHEFQAAGCPGDVNGDGALNVLDFVAFQQLWQGQDAAADFDGNGAFNVLDFVCFQQIFLAGCP